MKPIIGITVNDYFHDEPFVEDKLGMLGQEYEVIARDYIRELELAGATPILIPIYREKQVDVEGLLSVCDGLVISGGRNTDPQRYGGKFTPDITTCNYWRDEWELTLLRTVLTKSRIPVLGICRGIQIINVAAGGTLYSNVISAGYDPHFSNVKMPAFQPYHKVHLAEGSRLRSIMGTDVLHTNSFHSMCVGNIGNGLHIAGQSPDGLVEVLEQDVSDRFFIAVQFHPEVMCPVFPEFRKLFSAFIDACAAYHTGK